MVQLMKKLYAGGNEDVAKVSERSKESIVLYLIVYLSYTYSAYPNRIPEAKIVQIIDYPHSIESNKKLRLSLLVQFFFNPR